MNKFRWGFLSTAQIGRKNWNAILNSGNSVVTAVASRDAAKAEQFLHDCQPTMPFERRPVALGSYEALIESREVDAIYVPLPTGLRKEWVLRAAAAGKHVLCEKPCAVSAADLREMITACEKHGVQFMDGVMFMHNGRLPAIRSALNDGKSVGEIRRIMSVFSFQSDQRDFRGNIRVQASLEPAGCLGDLGWYCIRMALFAMRWQMPREVSGRILSRAADADVPTQFSGELIFDGDASAGFYCSFLAESQQWFTVSGARGSLHLPDFVHPFNTYEPTFEVNQIEHRLKAPAGSKIPADAVALRDSGHAIAQDTTMIRNFVTQARSGSLNTEWPEIALKTQIVMDACLASARCDGETKRIF
ncbi:MAG: Gfo/Idh/MocA family oxidoreductase [Verrucomicrobia bacterium]|nr:MAG: Gfo/Idh/MocA family oxidoreductase [Verrucomicrobiota bacterium]